MTETLIRAPCLTSFDPKASSHGPRYAIPKVVPAPTKGLKVKNIKGW